MGSQIDLGFSQRPGWKDKGNFNSVSCPGVSLERSRTGPSHCLKRVKVTAAGDRTLPHGMWLWLLTQQYQRYPMFSLPTLLDLALCWFDHFFHPPIIGKMLYFLITLLGLSHWLTFAFFISHPWSSHSTPHCLGPLFFGFRSWDGKRKDREQIPVQPFACASDCLLWTCTTSMHGLSRPDISTCVWCSYKVQKRQITHSRSTS